jgi:hypothetical protein
VGKVAVAPGWSGPGTVGVVLTMAGDTLPDSGDPAAVAAAIDPLRPVTAEVVVVAATLIEVDPLIYLTPDTAATRAAAEAACDLFFAALQIGEVFYPSRLSEALLAGLLALLPPGRAWLGAREPDSNFAGLLRSAAAALARVEQDAAALQVETDPARPMRCWTATRRCWARMPAWAMWVRCRAPSGGGWRTSAGSRAAGRAGPISSRWRPRWAPPSPSRSAAPRYAGWRPAATS